MKNNISEGNDIIANFIGITYDSESNLYLISESEWNNGYDDALLHLDRIANYLSPEDFSDNILHLYFNSSFDLLIPVCKKWDLLDQFDEKIKNNRDEYTKYCDELDIKSTLYTIVDIWVQLVENIKWYNTL